MADYTTLAAVKAAMGKTIVDSDAVLSKVITAISRAIDNKCLRPDGFVAPALASTRLFAGSGSGVLYIPDAAAITSVAIKANITDSAYVLQSSADWIPFTGNAENPDFNRTPYTGIMSAAGAGLIFTGAWASDEWSWPSGRRGLALSQRGRAATPTVQVTANWGYALTVPPEIEQACIIESARLFKRGQSAFADTLASAELGQLIQIAKLDPATIFLLEQGRYIRMAV